MRYLIIGLGIYGENLARDLSNMGHDVIGADIRQANVEALKNDISTVYCIDSTEEAQLAVLPLRNVDLVVVAIGENFGASIKTVALLKKAGVEHIYARAIDTLHEAILSTFNIERIITPEQRAAADLTHELELGSRVRTLPVDADNLVAEFEIPQFLHDIPYTDLTRRLHDDYGMTLIAACRPVEKTNIMGIPRKVPMLLNITNDAKQVANAGDVITVFGRRSELRSLGRKISRLR